MTLSYGDNTLARAAEQGAKVLEFWCLNPKCGHWSWMPMEHLLTTHGPGTALIMLARRARCHVCKRLGCYVQVPPRPAIGTPEWADWRPKEIERLRAELEELERKR